MQDREILRATFNTQALLYKNSRPQYPEELFDALVQATQLSPSAPLLEIGPGTGQATLPLAKRGYRITAIELGDSLAEVAREELKDYTNVEVISGSFEDVELPSESFDLVYAATAFHWIKPEVRFAKPHTLLKKSGHLAIIHTNQLADPANEGFFSKSQPIYEKYLYNRATDSKGEKLPLLSMTDLKPVPMDESLFRKVFFEVFPLTVTYNTDGYVRLVNTYSPTLAMSQEQREGFLNELRQLIDGQFNGQVVKRYGMVLSIGEKLDN
jgi:ubiquinone/menaquinone biosynthesis C-methylase UbiE